MWREEEVAEGCEKGRILMCQLWKTQKLVSEFKSNV